MMAPFERQHHFDTTYHFAANLPLDITSFWVLDYAYGSPLWSDAFSRGIVREHEFIVPAGSERGTQIFTTIELTKMCERYFFRFYMRPSYRIRQVSKFIRIRDKHLMAVFAAGLKWLLVRKMQLFLYRCISWIQQLFCKPDPMKKNGGLQLQCGNLER